MPGKAFIKPHPGIGCIYGYGYCLHMAKAQNIMPLKIIVISLGLLLIGGTLFVASVLVDKIRTSKKPCANITLSLADLNLKGSLISIQPHDNIVQLVLTSPSGNNVATLDRCTGKLLQQFTLTP